MASVLLHAFFLLLHNLLLHSAEGETKYNQKCSSFTCGNLSSIGFPFASKSHPECGVLTVECNHDVPSIQLGEAGRLYHVSNISKGNILSIIDAELFQPSEHRTCEFLPYLTSRFLYSSLFFIEIVHLPSETFYKCNRNPRVSCPRDYETISCKDKHICYNLINPNTSNPLPSCSVIQPPEYPDQEWSKDYDWFSILNPYIDLVVNVSAACDKCYDEGGPCMDGEDAKSLCHVAGKGLSKKQKIGICVGSSVGVLCLALIIYWGKSRGVLSKMPAKRTQSAASARSDVEAGSVYFGVPVYSYSELEEATNNFDVERELGDGGFGTVYYGKLRDGREVAIKRLYEHNYKRVAQFMNEVEILTRLRHRNLVSLYGCTSKRSRELLLVYEYIPNGTVADHIHGDRATPGSPPWPTRMSIAIETASALAYLHASEIIHRDVKTNNILLDHNFCVKVADFGISRLFPFDVTHVSTTPQGTPGYVDPEYHRCYQLTTKSDVYSFGVVLIELISSLPAVDLARQQHDINLTNLALKRIERSEYQGLIDSHLGFEWDKEVQRMTISVAQLAFRCIQHKKELRPSMDEVLEFLKQIQSGNEAPDDRGKAVDDDRIMNIKPPTPQDFDEFGLSKTAPLPTLQISLTDDWTSSSTTPNISS